MKWLVFLLPIILYAEVPDFDLLQGSQSSSWKKLSREDLEDISFYKQLFLKNYTEQTSGSSPRIPQIIHYIWLGPRPFPEESLRFVRSWKKKHPNWIFKFWTDRAERVCPIEGMEKHLITELSLPTIGPFLGRTENLGEKADMLRYEILCNEGGIYVDHDVDCYHSFSVLNRDYDFYACLEDIHPAEGQRTQIFACNCLIGSIPGHPLLQTALNKIAERWEAIEKTFPENEISRVMHRTFLSFTEAVRECAKDPLRKNLILPASCVFLDKVYSKKLKERLGLQKYAMASHKFSSLWQENKVPSYVLELKKSQKKQIKALNRRVKRLSWLTAFSLASTALLFFRRLHRLRRTRKHLMQGTKN